MAIATNIDLVGSSGRPVVTPQATEQLAGAFRSGFISADDIMERVSERTRAKEELELVTAQQGIADATDPALIQAKRSTQLLAGEQAQQTRDLLPLARQAQEEKLFGDIRSGQVARYGLKEKLSALNDVGFAPAPENGITAAFAADVEQRFNMMTGWQTKKGRAVLDLATIDAGDIVGPSGATGRGPTDKQTGAPIPEGRVQQLRKDAGETFTEYLFGIPPGGRTATPATAAPVIQPAGVAAPVIQPVAAPVAAAAPVIQPAAAPTEFPPGFVQVKPAPVTAESTAAIKRTDALQRELLTLDNIKTRIATARSLAVAGTVGPGQYEPIQAMHRLAAALGVEKLPFQGSSLTQAEIFTNQQQLGNTISTQIASFVQDWKGAISNKELEFFKASLPGIGSTPELWRRYLDQWENTTENVRQVALGQLAPPNAEEWAANPKSRLGTSQPISPTATTPAPPATPSALPLVQNVEDRNRLPAGTLYRLPDGTERRKL